MRRIRRCLTLAAAAAIAVTAVAALPAAAALGDPPPPVTREVAQGTQDGPVGIDVDGPVQVTFREITIPPGGTTGRHCHPGQVVGVVKSGTLTHYAPNHPGGRQVFRAGESIVEGSGYVHEGRNEGSEDLVLWATYVTPKGKPPAETDLGKCDAGDAH